MLQDLGLVKLDHEEIAALKWLGTTKDFPFAFSEGQHRAKQAYTDYVNAAVEMYRVWKEVNAS